MNKSAKTLSDAAVAALKPKVKPFKVADYDRLYILVSPSGIKRWYWSFRLNGKDSTLPLGPFAEKNDGGLNVEAARQKRIEAEKLVATGVDPREHEKHQKQAQAKVDAQTFAVIAQEWIDENAPEPDDQTPHLSGRWSHYYASQVRSVVGRYVINAPIGKRPVRSLTSADIATLVRAVAIRKDGAKGTERSAKGAPSVAIMLKQWCGAIFNHAILTGRADNNVAAQIKLRAKEDLKKPPTRHNLKLKPAELGALLRALPGYSVRKPGQCYGGHRATAVAVELLCLLAVRTAELRKARWEQFDIENRLWTIPPENMKVKTGKASNSDMSTGILRIGDAGPWSVMICSLLLLVQSLALFYKLTSSPIHHDRAN
jgi:integrase